MKLSEIAKVTSGRLYGSDLEFQSISTDSRSIEEHELFVALVGEKFDGHEYIDAVIARGACAMIVSRPLAQDIPHIVVEDTLTALGKIGSAFANATTARLVALTGSCGKTTTKEMIRLCLAEHGEVHATRGNLNNHIGVPLTLAELTAEHQFGVIEMGASGVGEIDYTVSLTQPEVVLITNASAAHLEGFGSFENIVKTKGEIIRASQPDSVVVLNKDDASFDSWLAMLNGRKLVTFSGSLTSQADVCLKSKTAIEPLGYQLLVQVGDQDYEFDFHALGDHMIQNALASLAVVHAMGLDVKVALQGLTKFHPVKGRLSPVKYEDVTVWDDTYNANPRSVEAAIQTVGECEGEKWLVLGEMAELGGGAANAHAQLGRKALNHKFSRVFAIGSYAHCVIECGGFLGTAYKKTDMDVLISDLLNSIQGGVHILVKGSRSAGMERVIEALKNDFVQHKNNFKK